ncbi:hypothetical protein Q4488_12345 [Amphritea sp. 1_MG-2023]|uniref:hypothetical protein n=1 Tax=Amphritea sp. 1_MG-2023 TaxID=3062670 RepID=UPI0026E4949F|nr:hypothetical protein [Amphritea sp. 1_MG-2023]MDO6564175.1 hypothetical protein [Amphritea sp. 1_MG-2023]
MHKLFFCLIVSAMLFYPAASGWASSLSQGEKGIYLQQIDGTEKRIGGVVFHALDDDQFAYQITLDEHLFKDYFLSMKEMKCLEGPELWCFIPYPYAQPRIISDNDFRWLEHDLLFMFKRPEAFGANFWHGIYYKLQLTDNRLSGIAQALDLNLLAAPPADLSVPPIGEFDIETADLSKRWLPYLEIR